jgi:hypothetical protein
MTSDEHCNFVVKIETDGINASRIHCVVLYNHDRHVRFALSDQPIDGAVWRISESHFRTCSGPTGSGKTCAASTFACERIPHNEKGAFIPPTIALFKQPYLDARNRFPDIKDRIRTIVTRRGSDDTIARPITHAEMRQPKS